MDRKKTTWIKEETNEIPSSPGSIVQVCPSSMKIKEESQETGNQECLEDPFVASEFTDSIKEDSVLSFGAEETENFMFSSSEYDPLGVKTEEGSTFENGDLGECDPLWITDDKEVVSKRCAPHSTRLIKITGKPDTIAFEETYLQGATGGELDITPENSADFIGSITPRQVFFSHKESTLCTRHNYNSEKNDFSCSSCKQTFSSKYCLIMHVFIHIDGVKPPEHICTCCGEVFISHDSLRNHAATQTVKHQEKCRPHTCGKFSAEIAHLKGQAESVYKSYFCGKGFSGSSILKKCLLTGEWSHKYGKSFTVADSVQKQSLIQLGEKRHKCDVCGKSFIHGKGLKRHVIIHTGAKTHKCDVCGKSFIRRRKLKNP
ncbi:zinc finger protein 112-like isoform X1 [Schistocerca nitens]|uniref:zinc finger protein 112-like isoform X1 n=1 Tax=Schistocerca nitens TaxID=7011 RepID=UPI002118F429|nr:zinc finger protein 112-like isoform X1 [Schistocerca nitens]